MRILFDSKKEEFKSPFGCLEPGQECSLHIHIPETVGATHVVCLLQRDGGETTEVTLTKVDTKGAYHIFGGSFALQERGIYFYYFRIFKPHGSFRLFKQGDDTNMEAGDLWQLSVIPTDFITPDWAKGATIYQVFPDRFHKSGSCDLTGKLQPYTIHENWYEEVGWRPTPEGKVLNNDFYGGNFRGIMEKMDYIASLGTTILYLNPISKSFSSHRYDTYKTPDPMLGTLADFSALCDAAHARGIRVILDGVYSHTGDRSLYFNRGGDFSGTGAYQSKESTYYSWYMFSQWPNRYKSWWDFDTLPTVNKMDPAFIDYIITGENSVVAHWLSLGADGFRLDVADELPDEFLLLLKKRIRHLKPDAYLLGEVWEDASNKTAYGVRRRYFVDGELDSVMNYPFRTAIIAYLRGEDHGAGLKNTVMSIVENYPSQVVHCNMNHLGTHDTARILTELVDPFGGDRHQAAVRHLSPEQLMLAKKRLRMASFLQYMLPGSPSLYYGDEAGMEGYKDPFNRRTYPWGREDNDLLAHFRALGQLRKENPALRLGDMEFDTAADGRISFRRSYQGSTAHIYCNRSTQPWHVTPGKLLYGCDLHTVAPGQLVLNPGGFCIVEEESHGR